jgi:signal transduction histidine kinase
MILRKKEDWEKEILQAIAHTCLESCLDLDKFLKDIVSLIAEKFPVECAEIRLVDDNNPSLLIGDSIYVKGRKDYETKKELGSIKFEIWNSLMGKAYLSGETQVLNEKYNGPVIENKYINRKAASRYIKFLVSGGIKSLLIKPLLTAAKESESTTLGCLMVINRLDSKGKPTSEGFGPLEKESLERIADSISTRMEKRIVVRNKDKELRIKRILDEIPTSPHIDKVMEKIQGSLCEFCGSKVSTIWFYDPQNKKLVLRFSKGLELEQVPREILDEDKCVIGKVLLRKEPIHLQNITMDKLYAWPEIRSKLGSDQLLAVPFVNSEGQLIGVISIHPSDDFRVTTEVIEVVRTFAEKATYCIEYARLRWREIQFRKLIRRLAILDTDKLNSFFENIVDLVREVMSTKACSLFTVEHKKGVLTLVGTTDKAHYDKIGRDVYRFNEAITSRVATEARTIMSYNISRESGRSRKLLEEVGEEHKAFIGVPITDKLNKVIAVLRCINKEKTPISPTEYFTTDDEELLTLIATLISKFIETAEIEKTRHEYTQALTHEILAPATGIMGHAEYLIRNFENPDISSERKILKLKDILDDCVFLDFLVKGPRSLQEKIEEYRIEDVDIYNDVIKPRINQLRTFAHSENLEFKLVNFEKLVFSLDRNKFDQIIFNLSYNAIKYSYPNTVIEIKLIEKDDMYEINFENFGIGVRKAHEEKIFEKYYRTEEAKSKYPTGKGLGCYIVKTICKVLRLQIRLTQRENPTIFTLSLPKYLLVRRIN